MLLDVVGICAEPDGASEAITVIIPNIVITIATAIAMTVPVFFSIFNIRCQTAHVY